MSPEPPNTVAKLNEAVQVIATDKGIPAPRAKMLVCSLVVSQMLPPPTIVKGGIGVKLRLGEIGTRATTDFDIATPMDTADFRDDLSARLQAGWGAVPPSKGQLKKDPDAPPRVAFTGRLRTLPAASPEGVPAQYVMQPLHVTLTFLGSDWGSVRVEVGHDELNGTTDPTVTLAPEMTDLAESLGFGSVEPVHLMSVELQLAQKIHAFTEPGSQRAHDLVDIQLLWDDQVDREALISTCERTFAYRQIHAWPPSDVVAHTLLEPIYAAAVDETTVDGHPQVEPAFDSAVSWFNDKLRILARSDVASPETRPHK